MLADQETAADTFNAKAEASALILPRESGNPRGPAEPFTKETAREFQARSVAARKANAAARMAAEPPQPARPATDQDPPLPAQPDRALEVIAREVERLDFALSRKNLKPSERIGLVGALDRLLERRRILQGLPLPGSERPGRAKEPATSRTAGLLGTDNGAHSITPGRSDQE